MRKSKRIIFTILVLGIILGIVSMGACAEETQSGIGVKVGYFMPGDEEINNLLGSGLSYGADYLYSFPEKLYGVAFGIEYFSKSIFPTLTLTITPITGSFLYFPTLEKNLYIGGGLGYYLATITAEGVDILSISVLGYHALAGYNFGGKFFVEAKYSTANFEGLNIGGINVLAGYRLKI